MPPALSDDESSSDDDVSYPLTVQPKSTEKKTGRRSALYESDGDDVVDDDQANGDAGEAEGEEGDEEDDDELGDEEYVVEKILDHVIDADGTLKFRVKWEGFEKKSDQTWEPEDTLREGASEVLDDYLAKQGGRDSIFESTDKALKSKKRGRPSSGTPGGSSKRSKRNGHPSEMTPPASSKDAPGAWQPPAGSWEDHIESIDACEDEKSGKLIVFLNWKNGKKTKHSTEVIYRRCPQKMLHFYENHVRIVKHETAAGNDSAEMEAAVAKSEAASKVEDS